MFLILKKKQRRTLKWIRKRNRHLPLCAILRLLHSLPDCQTISNPLTAFFNNASVKGVIHPDGTIKHYAPGTIEKWYRNYKEGGFDALIPTGRGDQGKPRKLDDDLQEQIRYLKTNYPRMSASAVYLMRK